MGKWPKTYRGQMRKVLGGDGRKSLQTSSNELFNGKKRRKK
jgi:hypothetical protein